MSKEVQFVINGIQKIFGKLVVARDNNNPQAYNTLTNSLREYMKTIWFRPKKVLGESETNTYNNLIASIENEMNKLEIVIDTALDKEDFKAHYKWLLSYQYLDQEKSDLIGLVKWSDDERKKVGIQKNKKEDEEHTNVVGIKEVLKKMNKPFLPTLWQASINEHKETGKSLFGLYLKNISIKAYRDLTWEDSASM